MTLDIDSIEARLRDGRDVSDADVWAACAELRQLRHARLGCVPVAVDPTTSEE